MILTGGLDDAAHVREAFERTGAAAVMLARGALGNPWLFAELLARPRASAHARARCSRSSIWTIDCAVEHLGEARATRYLRKFYPWYVARLEMDAQDASDCRRRCSNRRRSSTCASCCSPARRRSRLAV